MNWIIDIVTILGSTGAITAYIRYRDNKKRIKIESNKQELDEFKEIFKVWQEDNERLRKREEQLMTEIQELREEIAELKAKIMLLESHE